MTRSEIRQALKASDRWGINNQPTLSFMVRILEVLPVAGITMTDDATMMLTLSRPLSGAEAWRLCTKSYADEPHELKEDQTVIRLWWD